MKVKVLMVSVAIFAGLLAFGTVAQAAEEETHLFDASLSLTGDCSTSSVDPVADPGCPGGEHPPAGSFRRPKGVAVDLHGDRYVASYGANDEVITGGDEGRIDVFDSSGRFLTEVADPNGPSGVSVDSVGNLYVTEKVLGGVNRIVRFAPTVYHPEAGEIAYGETPTVALEGSRAEWAPVVNPANDHVFLPYGQYVKEYSSAAEGNELIGTIGEGTLSAARGVAIDAAHGKLYASDREGSGLASRMLVRVFELQAPHALLGTIDGSSTPAEKLSGEVPSASLAVDEASGDLFVGEIEATARKRVYEFEPDGSYVATIEHHFEYIGGPQIAFDNGPTSAAQGYLFVPSGEGSPSHSYAFKPKPLLVLPEIKSTSVSGVTADQAALDATVDPKGFAGTYRFQYTTRADYEAEGFAAAKIAGEGPVAAYSGAVSLRAFVSGLTPGTAYRFRLTIENEAGPAQAERPFSTYPLPAPSAPCPENEALRTGPSAALPDCRAYELVTPSDTNGHFPYARFGVAFPAPLASPDGERFSFQAEGGALPGFEGTGGINGDPYLATRTPSGWSTTATGPTGTETTSGLPGSSSADQGFSFWRAEESGSALLEGLATTYVRFPDGHSDVLGRGSLGTDPTAGALYIAKGGTHILFSSARSLEPVAPPSGTGAIYDRTPDGVTHVVSLLPGELTPAAGRVARYRGTSSDGEGVAFGIEGQLYLRYRDEATYAIGEGAAATFEGVAEGGRRIFYLEDGDLHAFDVASGEVVDFSESGDVAPVNVAAGGTVAYLASPSVLGAEPNSEGDLPQAGNENLYRSREGAISFIGTVSEADMVGTHTTADWVGLQYWQAAAEGRPALEASRSTPDGSTLLFESRAALTGYDPEGHTEIYRYDAEGALACLSCNPTGQAAQGDASLQSIGEALYDLLGPTTLAGNLRDDGRRAFFQTPEPLVLADRDGLQDVYEWEAQGVGGCSQQGGCIYLISSGQSARPDYLFASSASGDDVFIRSSDLLAPAFDPDETPSVYDARVLGGFAPASRPAECLGEACQPAATAPTEATPASAAFQGSGNVAAESAKGCARGKHLVRRHGRSACRRTKQKHRRRNAHGHPRQTGSKGGNK